ncbi:nucleoside-diphosphate-sugar epimerase [Methylopila capsulata]|uniref:NAD-dependent epimerase n=1 Tax=Methylopila capsulata TaxID=61654 RepID=A0A9W6IVY1_9HYPH|nr:D-erythronate dehydrogenase [Methylopila capsulata]MBM7853597.1 nucleoside-diphosphate-sugar epimerase [Methylopila capsulata]GLK57188.1 NAD-dependent epimerase [Methylopila capsulata]
MHILVIGAAGMVGRKLTEKLVANGALAGRTIERLDLVDVVAPKAPDGAAFPVNVSAADLSEPATASLLVADKPDVIFHLAAIVSGEAEADFDKGWRINMDGTRYLLEAIRHANYVPRLVFTSSIAVFGAPFPEYIPDDFHLTPLTSYGAQKACCELMLADYTRKGFVDGVGLRFPTIVVRPGAPNKAASGFFSGIIREPLSGIEAILPVGDDVRHWLASPRAAVQFLIHAAEIDGAAVGPRRNITLPGVEVTVGQMIEGLKAVAGDAVASRIRREPDATVLKIVSGWPEAFEAKRAAELGFKADASFEAIVRAHIEDELGGSFVA